ncbi:hypothetical protein B0H13DRAFT_1880496 [Mycena leptocephala]|nr:hypothetical protein B0H13DRAFT_1880496 [Mycena leptocephala]
MFSRPPSPFLRPLSPLSDAPPSRASSPAPDSGCSSPLSSQSPSPLSWATAQPSFKHRQAAGKKKRRQKQRQAAAQAAPFGPAPKAGHSQAQMKFSTKDLRNVSVVTAVKVAEFGASMRYSPMAAGTLSGMGDADGHIIAVLLGRPEGNDWGRQRSWAAGRIAGFQSSRVARYFPKLSKYMAQTMHGIEAIQSGLCRPSKNSVYPAVTLNLGPDTVTAEHRDSHNLAHGLKVMIEFPSGSTMGILSGALDHGNTPIAKGETRYSMTQYAAGALFRWAAYGYKTARTALETAGGAEKKASFDGDPGVRAAWVVNFLSKADEVEANRAAMFDNAPP